MNILHGNSDGRQIETDGERLSTSLTCNMVDTELQGRCLFFNPFAHAELLRPSWESLWGSERMSATKEQVLMSDNGARWMHNIFKTDKMTQC